jgi:putative multiple sugar transport system permease protein
MGTKVVRTSDAKTLIKSNIRSYSMFIILVLIMVIFAFLTNGINLSPRNITNIFFQYSYVLILAVGMVQVIIVRGIDLSVGSVCAFVGALSAMIYNTRVGMPITLAASILIGMGIGAWHGLWVAYAKLPAFIVTLAGMLLFRGLTLTVTRVRPISLIDNYYARLSTGTLDGALGLDRIGAYYPMPLIFAIVFIALFFAVEFIGRRTKIANDFEVPPLPLFVAKLVVISLLVLWLAERFASFRGLPNVVIVLGVTVFIFPFILNHTVLGRYIYAVGDNDRSAKLSGINSELVTFIVFVFMGSLAELAGVIFTGLMNTALPRAGNLFELDAIAASYIGGVSAGGGIGSVIGIIVGGIVMSAINNGMSLMNLGHHLQLIVKAFILLLAVFYDIYTRRKSGLG